MNVSKKQSLAPLILKSFLLLKSAKIKSGSLMRVQLSGNSGQLLLMGRLLIPINLASLLLKPMKSLHNKSARITSQTRPATQRVFSFMPQKNTGTN